MSSSRDDERSGPKWSWEPEGVEASAGERLLYEPGNWGDVLKGLWATAIVEELIAPSQAFAYLDPYAGAPTYPLSDAARGRLVGLSPSRFREHLSSHSESGRWPSTATLVRDVCVARDVPYRALLFDADPRRRRAWSDLGVDGVDVADVTSGEELLDERNVAAWRGAEPGLIVVDPYDLFDHWGRWLPRIERIAAETPVLAYLYDKSARGAGHGDQYRRLSDRLARVRDGGLGVLVGRVAADAVRPRAHHVVLCVARTESTERLQRALEDASTTLAGDQDCDTEYTPFER